MAVAPMNQSTVPGILKEFYDGQKTQWLTYSDNPFLAMIHKETKFPGKYYPNPVVYAPGAGGGSATFTNAYNNQSSPLVAEFLVTRVADFSLATIDGQLLAAAQTDPGAFIDGAELMIDSAWIVATNRLAVALFRNGAGTIGQMEAFSNVSAAVTITLTNVDDATAGGFEVGAVLVAVQNVDGSGSLSSDTVTITDINRNTGVILGTCSSGSPSSAWTGGVYYLAQQGDTPTTSNQNFQPSGSTTTNSLLKLAGLAAWLPVAGPASTGDTFFGVNRYVDPIRLAGFVFNGSQLSLQEAILQGSGRGAQQGAKVDKAVMSYSTYTALVTSMTSQVQYVEYEMGEIGFRGVKLNGANSVIECFPDRSCPDGLIYLLTMDDWVLRSQDEAPHILKYLDQIEILRIPGEDACELRIGMYGNLYCKKPGHSGVVQVQVQEF